MRFASRRCAIRRSTTSRREWLRWIGPICAAPTVRNLLIVTSCSDYPCRRSMIQGLRPCAFRVVGELCRAERPALEEIAHGIAADLGLLGLGMGPEFLGLAGGAITKLHRARIVPPARGVVRGAVQDLEAHLGMFKADPDQLHEVFRRDPDREAPHVEWPWSDVADP